IFDVVTTNPNAADVTLASPGAAGSLGANKNIVVDTTAPVVDHVTSSAANGSYGVGGVIPVQVVFNEPVNGNTSGGTPFLGLSTGSPATTDVAYSSGSGTNTLVFNYTVGSGNFSSDLDYASASSLSANGGTIQDAGLNNAVLTLASPGATNSLGDNNAIVVDGVAPTVPNVSATNDNGSYTTNDVVHVTVQFSENVNVTGTPQLNLDVVPGGREANYVSGGGSDTLTFDYTVQDGDTSADLDYVATTSL